MGRPVTTTVGPLVAASATKIGLSQKAAIVGTNYLVLNGANGTFTANSVCASQTPGGAVALTLNGGLASSVPTGTAIAYLPPASRIYITTAADESGKTFAVVGYRFGPGGGPYAVTETITGASTSTVSSINTYDQIISITASAGTSGAITVGHYTTATNDVARQVLFTDGGNDSSVAATVTGTDWAGTPITEAVTLTSGSTVATVLNYKTVVSISTNGAIATTISVGTNGVAASPWVPFDPYASNAEVAAQLTVSGTVNYTLQATLDDSTALNNLTTYGRPDLVTWVNSSDTAVVGATTTQQTSFGAAPAFVRILLNSGTGTVTGTFRQAFLQ